MVIGLLYSAGSNIAYQRIKTGSLLFLQMRTTLIEDTDLDAWVNTLERATDLRRSGCTLTTPDRNHRNLQARERLVNIQDQVIAKEGSSRIVTIGLVRAS